MGRMKAQFFLMYNNWPQYVATKFKKIICQNTLAVLRNGQLRPIAHTSEISMLHLIHDYMWKHPILIQKLKLQ